jgi:hypothetical protein
MGLTPAPTETHTQPLYWNGTAWVVDTTDTDTYLPIPDSPATVTDLPTLITALADLGLIIDGTGA